MQTLPDLVRPTRWRVSYRLFWGQLATLEVTTRYRDEALKAFELHGQSCDRVEKLEFWCLHTCCWKPLTPEQLQGAVLDVKEGTS